MSVLIRHARRGILLLALVVAGLGVASLWTMRLGRQALDGAESAFDRGDLPLAIRLARRAASLTVPGAEHVGRARSRLEVIARGAESQGETELARLAWEALGAATAESGARSRARTALERANQDQARLRVMLREGSPARSMSERSPADSLVEVGPNQNARRGTETLALGFLLCVLGLGWMGLLGVTPEGFWRAGQLALGGVFLAAGLAFWTFAVLTA